MKEQQQSLFDFLPEEDKMKNYLVREKSTDWKWTMKNDYPEKNGLKVFSCFACGGAVQWDINLQGATS